MNDRVIQEARCLNKGRHPIARAYGDRVEVRMGTVTRDGVTDEWAVVTRGAVGDATDYGVPATCPCGDLLNIDVAAMLRGDRPRVDRQGRGASGVSFRRRPSAVQ
ncbi:hypothetical protein [Cellulomonas sp. PSBB021]|uniref:hypothetical protein n=1 Tax=Cellulomonas sp. PSBB021 TaxID=2003551 RepID=UPI000B8D255D|nr:hypothetical protein [Cellulomonas sp. PSBB021]ASR56300.1 hypothetical protein CBP52_15665 [Cellulomonas sp. PSBB021]